MIITLRINKNDLIEKLGIENGKTPTNEELTALIKPLIPEVKDGEDGNSISEEEITAIIKKGIKKEMPENKPLDQRWHGGGLKFFTDYFANVGDTNLTLKHNPHLNSAIFVMRNGQYISKNNGDWTISRNVVSLSLAIQPNEFIEVIYQ